jgi:FkbM family methyltransferase
MMRSASVRLYHYLDVMNSTISSWLARVVLHAGRRVVNTPQGWFYVDPLSSFGQQLLQGREHEPWTLQALRTYLHPGSVFVDLGANEGYFSIQASKLCDGGGRVFAVEPQPRCQLVIRENLRLNECTNVILLPIAVWDSNGSLKLHLHPSTNTGATSVEKISRLPSRTFSVNCVTLESLLMDHQIEYVDLLKTDIEGAEFEAILGSKNIFRSGRVKVVLIEYHPTILARRGLSECTIHEFLEESGYLSDVLSKDHEVTRVYRWRSIYDEETRRHLCSAGGE